ncbi:MAG: PEP-CTERM sorting domain-containing protein [Planctomycetales bacterium]|nr:PEP-CTERM sorting domain-containing protein [Planctomycetales bacterium]
MLRIKHLAVLLALACPTAALAANSGTSIALNFGADEPNGAEEGMVNGAAGVAGTKNWNNLILNIGDGSDEIFLDVGGQAQTSGVSVDWDSANTWSTDGRGEDTNNAPDANDRALMLGYLDTSDVSVTQINISGIPDSLATGGYDVFVYVQNGVLNRGGTYTVSDATGSHEQSNITTTIFDGTYIEGEEGNYLVYRGLSGSDLTIEAMATDTTLFRGPVNAVEICQLNACTALPNAVFGRDNIGDQAVTGDRTNPVYGPAGDSGPGLVQEWFAVGNPGNKGAIDDIANNNSPVVAPFRNASGTTWWSGSDAPVGGDMLNYPDEVQPQLVDNYTVRLTGEIKIDESGTYRFADGVDDYTYLAIDLDKSGVAGDDPSEVLIDDNAWTGVYRADNGGGDGWAEADIDVANGGEWLKIEFNMGEGGGGDAGIVYWDYDPNAPEGQRIGGGVGFPDDTTMSIDPADAEFLLIPSTHLRSDAAPLLSGDIKAKAETSDPLQFDVNCTTNQSDKLSVDNPNPAAYTTYLDVDGSTFDIKSTGACVNGASFKIVDANNITGTPTITSQTAGQNWVFNAATGTVTLGGGLTGDYDGNGQLDLADLNLQAAAMANGGPAATYDLTNDGLVNYDDRLAWVNTLKKTWMGDANLDGEFNTTDFVSVFTSGKFETGAAADWSEGDWSGDGLFTSADFVVAFQEGGYEQGTRAAVAAVPEPSSMVLAMLSLFGVLGLTRRR